MLGKIDTAPEFGPVVVTVFDKGRVADYQKMVASLRNAEYSRRTLSRHSQEHGHPAQICRQAHSPCVIIQGSDEKARGEVQIKDLIDGAKAAAAIASNQEWRETRAAQFSCKEEELVAKVREVLSRHVIGEKRSTSGIMRVMNSALRLFGVRLEFLLARAKGSDKNA